MSNSDLLAEMIYQLENYCHHWGDPDAVNRAEFLSHCVETLTETVINVIEEEKND